MSMSRSAGSPLDSLDPKAQLDLRHLQDLKEMKDGKAQCVQSKSQTTWLMCSTLHRKSTRLIASYSENGIQTRTPIKLLVSEGRQLGATRKCGWHEIVVL